MYVLHLSMNGCLMCNDNGILTQNGVSVIYDNVTFIAWLRLHRTKTLTLAWPSTLSDHHTNVNLFCHNAHCNISSPSFLQFS